MKLLALRVIFIGCVLGGCEKPLFPEQLPRSPYERYDALRGRQRPMYEENAYGGSQPALRDRLKPLGAP